MASLYRDLVRARIPTDHHESDLYVLDTPEARELVKSYGYKSSTFTSNLDGKRWIDVPFAYEPFWEKKAHATKIGAAPHTKAAEAAPSQPAVVRKPQAPTMRYLYVLTVHNNKGTKLAELTGSRTPEGHAVVRLWNASQRKWQKGFSVVDTSHGYFVDERPAREADLKRYGFKLPAGHYLA
jgi:hypothetical protein